MDVTVGVYEAKTNLPKLLDRVAKGRRITITRRGVPVAVLVPPGRAQVKPIAEVIAALKEFGKGRRLRGMSLLGRNRSGSALTRFVLDCSVALAWCFRRQGARYTDSVLVSLAVDRALLMPAP